MSGKGNGTLQAKVRKYIQDMIQREGLKPGDVLPTEAELEADLEASRTTIRAALLDLQHEGYITRRQGKGTFVAATTYEEQLSRLTSFSEDAEARGKTVHTIVVSQDVIHPPEEIAHRLQITGNELIFKLVRLRYVDGEPMQLTTSHMSPEVSEKLVSENFDYSERSLYKTIESIGFPISDGEELMELSFADVVQSGLLQIEVGFPLFKTVRLVMGKNGTPLEYSISYTRGDRHRAHIHLRR